MLPIFGDQKPIPVAATDFVESNGRFSPDGRFVAYRSDESGRTEIYVQSFPKATGKWQISNAGGSDPAWRGDGKEIFYRAPISGSWRSTFALGDTVQAGVPQSLFPARVNVAATRGTATRDVDGQQFLFVAPPGREAMAPTTVVLNWDADLRKP